MADSEDHHEEEAETNEIVSAIYDILNQVHANITKIERMISRRMERVAVEESDALRAEIKSLREKQEVGRSIADSFPVRIDASNIDDVKLKINQAKEILAEKSKNDDDHHHHLDDNVQERPSCSIKKGKMVLRRKGRISFLASNLTKYQGCCVKGKLKESSSEGSSIDSSDMETSILRLGEEVSKLKMGNQVTIIQITLEEKMKRLILDEKKYFKEEENGGKKMSLMEWIDESYKTGENWDDLDAIRVRVVKLGKILSLLLVHLRCLLSSSNHRAKAKFEAFISTLKWEIDRENGDKCSVLGMIFSLIETTDKKLREGSVRGVLNEDDDIYIHNISGEDLEDEHVIQFLEEILYVERALYLRGLPPPDDSKGSVKDALRELGAGLEEHEIMVESMDQWVRIGWNMSDFMSQLYRDRDTVTVLREMELYSGEMWDKLGK